MMTILCHKYNLLTCLWWDGREIFFCNGSDIVRIRVRMRIKIIMKFQSHAKDYLLKKKNQTKQQTNSYTIIIFCEFMLNFIIYL